MTGLPSDFGFTKTRGGTRWEEWERGGSRVGVELVDDETGEWVAYAKDGSGGRAYRDAWSEHAARSEAASLARELAEGDLDFSGVDR